MKGLNLKRRREESGSLNQNESVALGDGPVGSRRRKESSEYSTTSSTSELRDNEEIEEDSGSVEDENDDSSRMPSGSDGEDGNDEREEDVDDGNEEKKKEDLEEENEKKGEDDLSKDNEDSPNLPRIDSDSENEDEKNEEFGNSKESDSKKEIKRFPWKEPEYKDDGESMENNVFYDLFVLELDDFCDFIEEKARAVWKTVEPCTNRLFAIIIGYTLYATGREVFDHILCEELVVQTVEFWIRHNREVGGDDYLRAVKRWEEGEQRTSSMEKNDESLKTVKPRSNSTEYVRRVPKKKLNFKMLDELIKKDPRDDDTYGEDEFIDDLKAYRKFNIQRVYRAWNIVSKLDRRIRTIVGTVFYMTKQEEVDIQLMSELVEMMWDSLKEFGIPVNW